MILIRQDEIFNNLREDTNILEELFIYGFILWENIYETI